MHEQDYEQLTLSLEDFPASPSVWLESKKGKTMTVTSGLRCSELSENLRRVALLVRTYLESSALPPGKWSRIWSKRAITLSCSILKLRLSALSIDETELRLWRTPGASDSEGRGEYATYEAYKTGRLDKGKQLSLSNQVKFPQLWPTPRSCEWKGAAANRYPGGPNYRHQLCEAVEATPSGVIGKLNPTWVEWLMGFPIGWTDLNASETPSCPSNSTQSSSL